MKRFVGKFVGAVLGFALGGPGGALIGFVIGHINDVRFAPIRRNDRNAIEPDFFPDFAMSREQRSVFAIGVIVLGAKLAKADGHVSREEIMAFRRAFRTRDSQLSEVGRLFDEARASASGYEPYAARLAHVFQGHPEILEEILAGLFYIAVADSPRLTRAEMMFLRRIGVMFGFAEADFVRIAGRVGLTMASAPPPPKHDSAYDVLGLPMTASDADIKKTYHALIRKYHPDKLLAAGLSADKVAAATEKMQRLNVAYADICKLRGMK